MFKLNLKINYIQLKYNSGYHTPFNFFNSVFFHICENTNKLDRVISQSQVENKMAPYRQEHGPLIQTSLILVAGYQIFGYRRQSCNIFALCC